MGGWGGRGPLSDVANPLNRGTKWCKESDGLTVKRKACRLLSRTHMWPVGVTDERHEGSVSLREFTGEVKPGTNIKNVCLLDKCTVIALDLRKHLAQMHQHCT